MLAGKTNSKREGCCKDVYTSYGTATGCKKTHTHKQRRSFTLLGVPINMHINFTCLFCIFYARFIQHYCIIRHYSSTEFPAPAKIYFIQNNNSRPSKNTSIPFQDDHGKSFSIYMQKLHHVAPRFFVDIKIIFNQWHSVHGSRKAFETFSVRMILASPQNFVNNCSGREKTLRNLYVNFMLMYINAC